MIVLEMEVIIVVLINFGWVRIDMGGLLVDFDFVEVVDGIIYFV